MGGHIASAVSKQRWTLVCSSHPPSYCGRSFFPWNGAAHRVYLRGSRLSSFNCTWWVAPPHGDSKACQVDSVNYHTIPHSFGALSRRLCLGRGCWGHPFWFLSSSVQRLPPPSDSPPSSMHSLAGQSLGDLSGCVELSLYSVPPPHPKPSSSSADSAPTSLPHHLKNGISTRSFLTLLLLTRLFSVSGFPHPTLFLSFPFLKVHDLFIIYIFHLLSNIKKA